MVPHVVFVGTDARKLRLFTAFPEDCAPRLVTVAAFDELFERGGATGAVIDVDAAPADLWPRLLTKKHGGVPWPAIVVLPDGSLALAATSAGVPVIHVSECRVRAWHLLRRAIIEWRLAAAAAPLWLRFVHHGDALFDAVHAVLVAARPISSVSALAKATGHKRTALYAAWTRVMGEECRFTLGDFLD